MIENLGDAYEAAEECYGMIWHLAGQLADLWASQLTYAVPGEPAQRPEPGRSEVLALIEDARRHYQEGLRLGGVSGS